METKWIVIGIFGVAGVMFAPIIISEYQIKQYTRQQKLQLIYGK